MIDRLINDGDVFFDIGANMGWYSINVALSKRAARIYSFEPIPKTFRYLQQNLELNAVQNVTAYNFGFSNHSGEIDFYYYDEGSGNASSAIVSNRDDVQTHKCKVLTLDEFSIELKTRVDFIKCDVEGAELMVFQGGLETIKRDCPIVFSEILRKWSAKFNYYPNEIFDLFRLLNYRAFTTDGTELKEFFIMDESTPETNFFFLHTEKHARKIQRLLNKGA
jgi:FkbM family methyltransferase